MPARRPDVTPPGAQAAYEQAWREAYRQKIAEGQPEDWASALATEIATRRWLTYLGRDAILVGIEEGSEKYLFALHLIEQGLPPVVIRERLACFHEIEARA